MPFAASTPSRSLAHAWAHAWAHASALASALAAALGILWAVGCGGGDPSRGVEGGDTANSAEAAQGEVPAALGTRTADPTETGTTVGGDPLQEGMAPSPRAPALTDSVESIPQTPMDSLRAEVRRLTQDQRRLARANDSLSGALAGLTAIMARNEPQEAQPDSSATEILEAAGRQAQQYGPRIVLTLLLVLVVYLLVRFTVWVLDRLSERYAARRLFYKRLVPIVRILVWAGTVYFAVRFILGVDAQHLLAAGAAVGVAVGFAAQDILKNIFGGILVVFDQPFQVGDKISVGGTYGEVVSIGLRSTRIVTPDDNLVTVPNAQVVDDQVANANAGELNCQVVAHLYLPPSADDAQVKRIAYEAAASSKYVFLEKPIVVILSEEFDQQPVLHVKIKAYVLDPRFEFPFMSEMTERARAGLRAAGIGWADRGVPAREASPSPATAAGEWSAR